MNTSLRLGSIAGIDIKIHWTFSLGIVGLFIYYVANFGFSIAISGTLVVLSMFFCVLLHELGHAFAAKKFNIPTRDITLYPIGGVARIERIPSKPMEELWIALAGPAVNLVIAGTLYLLYNSTNQLLAVEHVLNNPSNFIGILIWVNLAMVGFNMIPAFPMDGGRVLRAGLATKMSFSRATQIAGVLGQFIAVLMFVYALFSGQFTLIFIAIFVIVAAQQEMKHAALK